MIDVNLGGLIEGLTTVVDEPCSCIQCGTPMSELDGPGTPEHVVCPGRLLLDRDAIEWPEGTTLEQKHRVLALARDFRAATVDVGRSFDLPTSWVYVVVYPTHGGDFHAGIAPDGASHS